MKDKHVYLFLIVPLTVGLSLVLYAANNKNYGYAWYFGCSFLLIWVIGTFVMDLKTFANNKED